jgi:small subunit ribosomal protein S7
MVDGKKSVAERIFYAAMEQLENRARRPALEMFEQAVRNIMPAIEVRPRRVGGSTYQVPVDVRQERKVALALRWTVLNARKRAGRSMADKLAGELFDAANNAGASVKKKEDVHRMADANKAFAHYRW